MQRDAAALLGGLLHAANASLTLAPASWRQEHTKCLGRNEGRKRWARGLSESPNLGQGSDGALAVAQHFGGSGAPLSRLEFVIRWVCQQDNYLSNPVSKA